MPTQRPGTNEPQERNHGKLPKGSKPTPKGKGQGDDATGEARPLKRAAADEDSIRKQVQKMPKQLVQGPPKTRPNEDREWDVNSPSDPAPGETSEDEEDLVRPKVQQPRKPEFGREHRRRSS